MNRFLNIYSSVELLDFTKIIEFRKMQKITVFDSIVVGLMILLVCFRFLKILPSAPMAIYYSAWGILALLVLMKGAIKVNFLTLLFLVFCLLSILGNMIPEFFHVHERYFGMLMIVFCVGPFVNNEWISKIRIALLGRFLWVLVVVSVVSFLLYFIYRPITQVGTAKLFGGITTHSMLMGPMGAISMICLVNYTFLNRERLGKMKRNLLIVLAFFSFSACVLSGSRSAFISAMAMLLGWLWFYTSNVKQFLKFLVGLVFLVAATSPIWWTYTEAMQNKMKYAESQGSFSASRDALWTTRIKEFESSPVWGIGFATVSIDKSYMKNNYEGNVEPGNGWLFVLSSTGIISFVLFASLYFKICWKLYRRRDEYAILYLCLLIFFALHMNAEGYTLSAGAPMFFMLWLTLGTSYSYLNNEQEIDDVL